jgi:hypothetical protein
MAGNQNLKDEFNIDEFSVEINPAIEEKQILQDFKLSDQDTDTSTIYLGFLNAGGAWIIKRFTETTTRYVRGSSGYDFSNRTSESYDLFNNVF